MPFCRDCAYFTPGDHDDPHRFATCQNAASTTVNPVSGAQELAYCAVARYAGGLCGPDAKLFEPVVPIAHDDEPASLTVGA